MKRSSYRATLWLTVGIVAVLAALCVGTALFIKRQTDAVRLQTLELVNETQRQLLVQDTNAFFVEIGDDKRVLSSFFASPDDVVGTIERIETLAQDTGASVTLGEVHVENSQPSGEGTLVLNVTAEGSWTAVTHLLALIDTLPVVSTIESVALVLATTGDEENASIWTLRSAVHIPLRR